MTRNIWRQVTIASVLAASFTLNARESHLVEANPSQSAITIPRLDHPPKLEDFLEMKPAPGAPTMTRIAGFIQHDPKDGAPAQQNTEVYIGYDARNFYAVFVCYDDQPDKLRARMARREDIGPEHDEVQLYLDTFNDRRRAYGFMINPLGIQYDFIWTESGGYDSSWDTVWESRGKVTSQGYVAMMAIPFKSLRFSSAKEQTWGILFQRVVPHDNDNSFYPHVSASVQGRLSQEASLSGLEDIRSGRNIQLVPYGLADAYRTLDQRDPDKPFFTASTWPGAPASTEKSSSKTAWCSTSPSTPISASLRAISHRTRSTSVSKCSSPRSALSFRKAPTTSTRPSTCTSRAGSKIHSSAFA